MNDFKILLQAVLDANSINQSDIDKIQKVISKYHLNLTADLDKASVIAEIKKIVPQLEAELKKMTGVDIQINDSALLKAFNQIEKQAESTAQKLNKIQHSLSVGDYDTQLKGFETALKKAGIEGTELDNRLEGVKTTLDKLRKSATGDDIIPDNVVANAKALEVELKKLSNNVKNVNLDKSLEVDDLKVNDTITKLNEQLRKNTAYSSDAKKRIKEWIKALESGNVGEAQLKRINSEAKRLHSEMAKLGKIGLNWVDKLKQAWEKFGGWSIATGVITTFTSNIRSSVTEIKELDDILTEISKTSDLTAKQLERVGLASYDTASKYGRKADSYLTGVQEMYRAGFDNAEQMAELSILAQSAGDMEINSANDYVLATNAAYDFKGSVEELNKVLDSQNYITNNAAVSMQDMADATSEAASIASQYGVEIDELSALIAVAVSKTRESGSEIGTALKALLINLQDTTSKPITEAFDAVGISMTKMVNGSEQLKTPIELIKELSVAFNSLPEGDVKRANILNDIGGKHHANTLSAILQDLDSYNSMLELYNNTEADNSAFEEAQKSANNLTGSINKLSNEWTELVNTIVNADTLKSGVNFLTSITSGVQGLIKEFGLLSTTIVGILTVWGTLKQNKSQSGGLACWHCQQILLS